MASIVEVSAALSRFKAERIGNIGRAVQRALAVELGTRIVQKTPVRTGLARGNWRLGLGLRVAQKPLTRKDPIGASTIQGIVDSASRIAAYSSFSIYNNLPYIQRLENGWSRQAPMGMVRISVQEVKASQSKLEQRIRDQLGVAINVA